MKVVTGLPRLVHVALVTAVVVGATVVVPPVQRSAHAGASDLAPSELEESLAIGQGARAEPGSLAAFWSSRVEEQGQPFDDVGGYGAYLSGESPPGSCPVSADVARGNAFYCKSDRYIRYDLDLMLSVFHDFGRVGALTVLAHEYGHHVQTLLGEPMLSIRQELQADCYAGLYLRHLVDIGGILGDRDIMDALSTIWSFGDDVGGSARANWTDPGVHGRSDERRRAAGVGYTSGDLRYCLAFNGLAEQPPVALDEQVEVHLAPGVSVTGRADGTLDFDVLGTHVYYWPFVAAPGDRADDLLGTELSRRFPSARTGDTAPSWLDDLGWVHGDAAGSLFERRSVTGMRDEVGFASVIVEPSGIGRLFVAAVQPEGTDDPGEVATVAMMAVMWGYCDRRASDPSNCPPLPSATITPSPRATPAPTLQPDGRLPRSVHRRMERMLTRLAPDSIRHLCRPYRERGSQFDPFASGAVVAIDCAVNAEGIDNFAVFFFGELADLRAYYRWRVEAVNLSIGSQGCWDDTRGETTWAHGRLACWVTRESEPRVAHLRWTDERGNLFGILNGSTNDIGTLVDFWLYEVG